MKILGVVTARGGSSRVPNKNIAMLGNKPLIGWSIEVGLATCHRVVTSTDSEEIEVCATHYGSDVVRRPAEIAKGLPGMQMQAILQALDAMEALHGPYEAVLLLQPTSPFRTVEDVMEAVGVMDRTHAESVISIVRFPVEDMLFKRGWSGRLRPAANDQDWIYTPNGAVYLARPDVLRQEPPRGGWYGPGAYGFIMSAERSLDIDTHADLDAARAMVAGRAS